jgi:putative transcriptional regulator
MIYKDFSDLEIQDFNNKISQKIKQIRVKKGIKQIDLATAININSTGSYSDYENNKQNKTFNLTHLYKISKALDIDICTLLS